MPKKIPYGTKLPIRFSLAQRDLIQEHTFYDPNFGKTAVTNKSGIRVQMSLIDIEELHGYIAASANHCDDARLQRKLDTILRKLERVLDSYYYDDQE